MEYILIFAVVLLIIIVISIICGSLKSPFVYPYKSFYIDVSGKKQPNINDYVDEYLIKNGINEICGHYKAVEQWKTDCEEKIKNSILKEYRMKQFRSVIDDENMFRFTLYRQQTRYRQVNYVKYPYKSIDNKMTYTCDLSTLLRRNKALEVIGKECTISKFMLGNQRKLMTAQLREEITIRDNYTCQICGKYMPDGVGLQIDHIIPISKGGKSIPSNLQVLCSKCNGKKSNKTNNEAH